MANRDDVTLPKSAAQIVKDETRIWLRMLAESMAKDFESLFVKLNCDMSKELYKEIKDPVIKDLAMLQKKRMDRLIKKLASPDLEKEQLDRQKLFIPLEAQAKIAATKLPVLEEKEKEIDSEIEQISNLNKSDLQLLQQQLMQVREIYEKTKLKALKKLNKS